MQVRDSVVLLVSQVVTIALLHFDGRVVVGLSRFAGRVLVKVTDDTCREPAAAAGDPIQESGRGLPSIDALSDRWSTAPHGAGV